MFVSLAYVDRQMARDREEMEAALGREDEIDFPEDGTEWWDRNRGVSGAMSRSFDLQVTLGDSVPLGITRLSEP